MSRFALIGLCALALVASACSSRVRVVPDQNHLASRMAKAEDAWVGTYQMDGNFLGTRSSGHTVEFKKEEYGKFLTVERKSPAGKVEGIGIGYLDGDSLVVAWSSAEGDSMEEKGRPEHLEFEVFDFSGARVEGATLPLLHRRTGLFENYRGVPQPKPSAVPDGQSAEYVFAEAFLDYYDSQGIGTVALRRTGDRFEFFTNGHEFHGAMVGHRGGVALAVGDRVYAATVYEKRSANRLGVSVFKRDGNALVGQHVWRETVFNAFTSAPGARATPMRLVPVTTAAAQ